VAAFHVALAGENRYSRGKSRQGADDEAVMQALRTAAHVVRAALVAAALAGCTLPRSGPTAGEILAAGDQPELGLHIVNVNPAIAQTTRLDETLGFGAGFIGASPVAADTIRAGDTLSVSVWENVDAGLLAGVGQRATVLEEIQVDEGGEIFVPYAGRLQAAGLSPDQLRREITASLEAQTPDPQVEVRRIAGDGATVSVMGAVSAPGVYPIEVPTRRLSAMIAAAGGVAIVPDVAQVTVERAGDSGTVWLQDLYDNAALDVALRADDRIIVEEDRRSFTALGASTTQERVRFTKRDMSALEALASVGGLDGRAADPTGVFVFRLESEEVARRVLGRTDLYGPQRMVYLIDLTRPEGLFSAREFIIRDEDTIYITEAPFAAWSRVLTVATSTVNLGGSVAAISNR
jgi:polysaccharide export outer membrane protein